MQQNPRSSLEELLAPAAIAQAYQAINATTPLIHNITNFVVMQTTANMLLAIGASPIMAHAQEELEELLSIANALVINIGTLDKTWIESIALAQTIAHNRQIPIIFDPVGAGASLLRTQTAKQILERGVTIIRGNASEILCLSNQAANKPKGVDSHDENLHDGLHAATTLSNEYGCCVTVSGKTDIVCHRDQSFFIDNGTSLLTRVTGMGCSATALIGAFAAIQTNPLCASIYGMATLNIAAEKAENQLHHSQKQYGPGSFHVALLDVLYHLDALDFERANIKTQLL